VWSREYRILAVWVIPKAYRKEVMAGRLDIKTQLLVISWFNLFCWLKNTEWPSLYLAEPPGT
jgi:hypothetical protein